jgi:hypothetical protein
MPTPLQLGTRTLACRLPHIVVTAGLVEGYATSIPDRVALRMAYLGYCLPGAPPRHPSESWEVYGQRVYDWLLGEGAEHGQVLDYADQVLAEGIRTLPRPPSEEELDLGGAPSGGAPSTMGSRSPGSGPATPCGG